MKVKEFKTKYNDIYIYPIGDTHIGDKGFTDVSEAKLKGYIDFIKKTPNAFAILQGDLLNCATRVSKSSPFEQKMDLKDQIAKAVELLKPIKNKILGAIDGNHEQRIADFAGYSPTISVCERLEVDYMGDSVVYIIRMGCHAKRDTPRSSFTLYSHHTTGGNGRTLGSKINRVGVMREIVANCDVYCLGENSMIKTKEGFFRIKDIREGDKVLTKEGDYKKVTKLYKRETDSVNYITTQGGFQPLTITSNHPVLVADIIKKRTAKETKFIVTKEPYFKDAGDIKKGDFLVLAKDNTDISYSIPEIMGKTLDDELATFIGLYLAEGNTSKNGIALSLHDKEKDLIKICKNVCTKLNVPYTESIHKGTHSYQIHIHSKRLMTYFLEFGKTSHSKRIPEKYYYLNNDLTQCIVNGYFLGDGHKKKSREIMEAKTVSQELAYGMGFILNRLGRRSNISYSLPRKHKFNINGSSYISDCAATYTISYSLNDKLKRRIQTKGYDLVEVIDVSKLNKKTNVYNLEVEDSHTYTANGIIVHNCGSHNHMLGAVPAVTQVISATEGKVNVIRQMLVDCGGYLEWDGTYAERMMLPPLKLGSPRIHLILKRSQEKHKKEETHKDVHISL